MKKMQKVNYPVILFAVIILILILVISGCKKPSVSIETTSQPTETTVETTIKTTAAEITSDTAATETQAETIADLSKEVENKFAVLDKSVNSIADVFVFIDQNIKNASPEPASEMVYTIIKLCEEYKFSFTDKLGDPSIQEAIISSLPSLENIDLSILSQSNNQKVKNLAREAIDKKYKLMAVEGFVMPLVDYKAYAKYRPYLTPEMNDYLNIKLDESEKPSVMDVGIVISIDDFVARIIKSMDYVSKYPESSRRDEVQQFNNGRIYMYLSGIDNNPVFDSNNKILPDRLAEYQNILVKYGDTDFGKILGQYLDLLSQENYIRTQQVDDFLNSLQ